MKLIHEQAYDGGWLIRIEHRGKIYTGTGWSWNAAYSSAEREAVKKECESQGEKK